MAFSLSCLRLLSGLIGCGHQASFSLLYLIQAPGVTPASLWTKLIPPCSRGVQPLAWGPHVAQDGYECVSTQNCKLTSNLFFFAHQFSLVYVYFMCGPRQLFFQCGPELAKVWKLPPVQPLTDCQFHTGAESGTIRINLCTNLPHQARLSRLFCYVLGWL